MEFSDRLTNRMAAMNITAADISREIKVSRGTLSHWTNGTNKARGQNLIALARLLQCNAEWLETGKGSPEEPGSLSNVAPALQPFRAPQTYPVISWVAAGQRADSPDNFIPGDAEDWLPSTENAGPHGYWLITKGPSMTSPTPPSFPDGTPVLIKPEGFDLVSGKFYIAKHRDGETTFKQYIYDSGREYLVPLNKEFKQVEMDDAWEVIGRVIDAKQPRGVL